MQTERIKVNMRFGSIYLTSLVLVISIPQLCSSSKTDNSKTRPTPSSQPYTPHDNKRPSSGKGKGMYQIV